MVVDASVIVRAGVLPTQEARAWTERFGRDVNAFAPDVLWAEVTNALRRYVVAKSVSRGDAHDVLDAARRLQITLQSTFELAPATLETALDYGLSAYDACYVALAEVLEGVLVTADRRLAEAAPRAELIV